MKTDYNLMAIQRIALVIAAALVFGVPRVATADSRPSSASEAIRGALDNVRRRYQNKLDYFGLTELCYVGRKDVCSLDLDMPGRAAPLHILYDRADNSIQYPQVIPKGLAQQLICDRMMIDSYQKVLRADEINSTTTIGAEREYRKEFEPKQIEDFLKFRNAKENQGLSAADVITQFAGDTGLKRNEVRMLATKAIGLDNMTEEEKTEAMRSSDVWAMVKNQEREKKKAAYKRVGAERAQNITREEAAEAIGGKDADADAGTFLWLRDKMANGEELNKHEKAAYDKYTEKIGKYVVGDRVGRSVTRGERRGRAHIMPRRSRYETDEGIAQWQKDWIAEHEKIKQDLRKEPPRSGRTVRGKELIRQRAKQNSKGEISITGNRRGKLTLTGK